MVQLGLFPFVSFFDAASGEIERTGFITIRKQRDEAIGKSEEEAKEYIRKEFSEADFLVVDEDIIPSEGHMHQVLMSESLIGEVIFPAKYTGYAPVVRQLNPYRCYFLPAKLWSYQNGKTVYTCCQREYDDNVRLDLDASGLLLHLPLFVPHKLED